MHVEDHPLEYGDFEGTIPKENYGAGAVIVWDRGLWTAREDPREGMKKGKLLFDLGGYKLRGLWTLVRTKRSEKEWLLIKERDGHVRSGAELPQESVVSGMTVEELRDGPTKARDIEAELEQLKAPQRMVAAKEIDWMLAEAREDPP
jgi:bifunctional non-homologous end joining protein LigD